MRRPLGVHRLAIEHARLADGKVGDIDQTAQAFWVDLFAGRQAPVRRIRIETQVLIGDGWTVSPLEVRVRNASLGNVPPLRAMGAGDLFQPASASVASPWRRALCGFSDETKPATSPLTIRNFIARNAAQDVRLAGGVAPPALLRLVGVADRAALCRAANWVRPGEDYLDVRDVLVGARE